MSISHSDAEQRQLLVRSTSKRQKYPRLLIKFFEIIYDSFESCLPINFDERRRASAVSKAETGKVKTEPK